MRRGVAREIVEHVAEVHVEHVTERHEVRKADAARRGPIEHRRHDGTRLCDECDAARRGREMCEARVDAERRHGDTQRVRAYDSQ